MAAEREASDVIWRNARLATMVENGKNPYGILDGYDLIVRGER